MTFNVNTDVNYQAYLTQLNALPGFLQDAFREFLIRWFATQCTAGTTLVTVTSMNTAISNALSDAKSGNYTF